jgi:tetratricopeptide (TPR) repeat protein
VGRQTAFGVSVGLLNRVFPKMGGNTSLYGHWHTCSLYIDHVLSLAAQWSHFSKTSYPLKSTLDMDELLKNAAWYLFEIGEMRENLALLEIALESNLDKGSLFHSQLLNNKGCLYHDLNNLGLSREAHEGAIQIRKALLSEDDPDLVNSYNNLGNLMTSEGNFDESIALFENVAAARERTAVGEDKTYLHLAYLSIGRAHLFAARYGLAQSFIEKALGTASPKSFIQAM